MINKYHTSHSLRKGFTKKECEWRWEKDGSTIEIPVHDKGGNYLFSKYRHLEGKNKFTNDKGARPALYCAHKVKNEETVVLSEGEPDCVRLWQEGIPAVTGTGGVKTFSVALAKLLKGKEIIICLDTDEAGQSSIEKYYSVLLKAGTNPKIKLLPEKYKDICEYFTAGFSRKDFESLPNLTLDEWHDENEPEEFKFETIREISEQNLPEEEWLLGRIIPVDGFTFIIGAEATGKSFYTLGIAKAVATGRPWMEKTAVDDNGNPLFLVKKAEKVLIIDKENSKRRRKSRLEWFEMNKLDNVFYLKYSQYFELADPNEEDGLSKIAKSASRKVKREGIKFIIVDAFTDVMVGNENAAGDVQAFFDAMRKLFPDTSILVLHHASKPAPGTYRTSAQRARGSTNIMAQVYSAFHIEALPRSRTEFTFEQTKAGDALKLPKFIVELDVQPIDGVDGKTKVVGILHKGVMPDEEAKRAKAISLIEEVMVSSQMLSRQELFDICLSNNISERTTRRAIKDLVKTIKLDEVPSPGGDKRKKSYVWIDNAQSNRKNLQAD